MDKIEELKKICRLIRYDILTSTTKAGSGHPTSCLSAVELMTILFFGGFLKEFDRLIFSKGHAAPLLYALYHVAGLISYDELLTLRTFNSRLEGHPTPRFPYIDVATGSLGQGLSVGLGMALGMRLKNINSKVFVLLGDSEMTEGQIWEAMQIASYYKLNNLIAILDVNRLGQRGETMLGWDINTYAQRTKSFGWNPILIEDGNNIQKVFNTFSDIKTINNSTIIIAKTIKGKGVSFLENQDGWHGKPVPKDKLDQALKELGPVDLNVRGKINLSNNKLQITNSNSNPNSNNKVQNVNLKSKIYDIRSDYSTREAYGDALCELGISDENIVVLDAETSNSTYAYKFAKKFPNHFFEMFIAEQNMISAALGLSKQGFISFVSTFAAFLTRGFDQIRMSQYSNPNLKVCGSHCGVSIGADGPSQMGLEDIAMFRAISNSVVFYPSDAVSTFKLTQIMAQNKGLFYLRASRGKTPIIYKPDEEFKIGGSKILRQSEKSKVLVIAAGITIHEALKAYNKLIKERIEITILDLYSVKPIDLTTVSRLTKNIGNIIVVEDHYPASGIGEAVLSSLGQLKIRSIKNFIHLCVKKLPRSGTTEELLAYEEIDASAIIKAVKSLS